MSALRRNARRLIPLLLFAATGLQSALGPAQEKKLVVVPGVPTEARQDYNGVFLPSDRTLSRGMQRARERIATGEYSRAIRFLDEVLDPDKEDSFVIVGNEEEITGLKSAATQILRELPAEGRLAYETIYGPVASRELRRAIDTGDFERLRRVAQRYFYTPSGFEAALLLARHEADMGRHFAAGLAYQQLIETPEAAARFQPQLSVLAAISWFAAGDHPRARALIEDLRNQNYRTVRIAGEEHQLDAIAAQPLEWLQQTLGVPAIHNTAPENQWLTYRGNSARNGQVEGGLPHMRVRWRVRLLANHKLEALYDDLVSDLMRSKRPLPIATSPLAVGDTIIIRSAHNLSAVDFQTGKRIWAAQPQHMPAFENLVNETASNRENEAQANSARSFTRRIWEDYLYGSISSDGQRVYAIRDLRPPELSEFDTLAGPFMGGRRFVSEVAGSNRLCAFELATQGKLVWEIDGAADQGEFKEAFFLGAPLAVGQSVYCLMEMKSAIYLAAIDPQSGQLQWRQQLANLETGILLDSKRRLQAAIPSYEAGILVCPTGAGVVVGVDLAKNALAWAYRYETNRSPTIDFRIRGRSHRRQNAGQWIDSSATLADGRILLTPPESNSLHCLDLLTGKLLWKLQREDQLFVAGVHQNLVLLVGNHHLSAVRLENGKPAWQEPKLPLPNGSVPTGQGFFSKGKYFLPLSTAEVVAIDIEQGAIVGRAAARRGRPLGNLVCHRGAVLSQNGLYLDRFDQVDVLRDKSESLLAKDPTNVEALRTLGEIAYNEGRLSQAIELLERAYQSSAKDLRTREVLSESLVIALDEDFASYRERLPLLRKLQENSGNGQLTLLRLEAHGLLEIGDPVGAFESCLDLYAAGPAANDLLSIGRYHQVEVARWLRAQVAAIWAKASSQEKEEITSLLQNLIEQLPEQPGDGEYRRLIESMPALEIVAPVAMRLARKYSEDGRPLETQQLLMHLAKASDERLRAEAVARCSRLLHQLELPRLSRPFDEELSSSLADVICLDGKTGRECLEQWGKGEGSVAEVLGISPWPYGEVEVSRQSPRTSGGTHISNSPSWGVRLERTDAVLGRCNVMLLTRRGEILVRDSYGKEFFRAPLADKGRIQMHDPSHVYAVSHGNLLVVSLGRQLVAFDTLQSPKHGPTEALWRIDVANALDNRYQISHMRGASRETRPGTLRAPRSQSGGKWIGVIGPLTQDSCIFQNQRRLVCVDSRTGETRWTRSDVPEGCDLYGDEQYVLAVPRGSKVAQIYSTADGRSLGETTVPTWQEQLATLGRHVIRWRSRADGRRELSSYDAVAEKTVWKQDFHKTARVDVAMNRYVAVVDHLGRCVIVDASDGSRLVEQTLPLMPKAREIHLLAGSNDFVLAVQRQTTAKSTRRISGLNRVDFVVIDGSVYVFDRKTGMPVWTRPAEVHRQALMLSQPVDAPVIAFVGNMQRRDNAGSHQGISMMLLEKSSGRNLFSDDMLPASAANHCVVQAMGPEANEVLIEMASQSLRLKFTGRHRPPEPPAMSDVNAGNKSSKKGLLGILQKTLGGG